MNIKTLKKPTKAIKEFNKAEWIVADKEHYGKAFDWWNPKTFMLVAMENNEILGTLDMKINVDVTEINALIVSHTKQGKGTGTALLKRAEKLAKLHGSHKLYLITGKGWRAESFYKKFGMTKTGDLPNHYAHFDFVEYSKFI